MEFTFNKVANLQPATLVITNSTMGVFLEIFQVFQSNYYVSRLQSHYEEAVYFLPLSSQKFLVLI